MVLADIGHLWSQNNHKLPVISTGGTFIQNSIAFGLAVQGAGTYKLPDNGLPMYVQATGSVTIQNASAVTVATLTSGQIVLFIPLTSTTWVAHGPGAGGVSVTDSNNYTTQTTAEAWLNEVAAATRVIEVDISRGILAAGTPLAAFADNASPNPGITLANSKAVGIRWNNNATQNAPVWFSVPLPYTNFDTSVMQPTLRVLASKVGATVGDATTFTCTAFRQTVGALHDVDGGAADNGVTGGITTAMTGNATSKTVQEVSVQFADFTGGTMPKALSLSITPTSGTLGTDDVIIHRIWMTF